MESAPVATPHRLKRPASHKWAIACFAAFVVVNVFMRLHGNYDPLTVVLLWFCGESLVGAFWFARSRRTYLASSLTLVIIIGRSTYYSVLQTEQQWHKAPADLFEYWLALSLRPILCLLTAWMVVAYIGGTASRRYFGFLPGPGADDQPPGPR